MIQSETKLVVADNTGARVLQCIQVLGTASGKVGDSVVGVVKEALPKMSIQKSDVVRGILVRQRAPLRRNSGMWLQFDDNAVVLLSKDGNPRGSRIFGSIARELRTDGRKLKRSLPHRGCTGETKLSTTGLEAQRVSRAQRYAKLLSLAPEIC